MLIPRRGVALSNAILVLCVAVLTLGCPSTFQYRAIQAHFMGAVRADNDGAVDPLVETTATASYASIAEELTDDRIDELDEKLRGNAWVIRSYSEWRAGFYAKAMTSARKGAKASGLQPRDKVLLELIDALAQDSETKDLWVENGSVLLDFEAYEEYDKRFARIHKALEQAEESLDASTPPGTKYYVAYQRWRILRNWDSVISSVDRQKAPSQARDDARALARNTVRNGPKAEADAARDEIPDDHPLRRLIKAAGGG